MGSAERQGAQVVGQRWLEEKEHATFVCQFSNLLTLNGIIIQLAFWCRYAVNNMHAYGLPTFLKGQTMRANMFAGQFVLFCSTKEPLFFGQKAKAPPPPPGWLTQRGIEWEARHKYFATQRFQHLWHLIVCHTAITCHKVASTLLSPSLALMLGSTTYPEHCCENISPKRTRKQRAVRGMHHLQKQPPPCRLPTL